MNVFLFEFKQYRKALIGWTIGLLVILSIYMPFLPAFMNEGESMRSFFEGLGGMVIKGAGINIDLFFQAIGFYGFIFMLVGLAGAIQALSMGLSVISKEGTMRAADFLMTKPCRRSVTFLAKAAAVYCCLLITEVIFFIGAAAWLLLGTKGVPVLEFTLVTLTLVYIQFFFFMLGLLVGAFARKVKSVPSVALGIALFCFMLGIVANITDSEWIRYLSPLRYFDNNHIIAYGAYEAKYLILNFALAIIMGIAAFIRYVLRDIKAV